jgi:hypothetical protein
MEVGQAIHAVTGTRRFGFGFSFLRKRFLLYATASFVRQTIPAGSISQIQTDGECPAKFFV